MSFPFILSVTELSQNVLSHLSYPEILLFQGLSKSCKTAVSLPFTAPVVAAIGIAGTALAATKVGALVATGIFCLLTIAFASMARRQDAQQYTVD